MRPTRQSIAAMTEQVMVDLAVVKSALRNDDGLEYERDALASVETFIAIALRVIAKTNASKIRDIMRTVEIVARMDGKEVM